jgi:RimJ/RimL family protein N-acetyltransferase
MHRILDLPSQGGLGLRRCQWHTTTLNEPSQKAALRLGFKYEGTIRAQKVLAPGKIGARRKWCHRFDVDVEKNFG